MKFNPWFRCECGKLHILTVVLWDRACVCACGRNLCTQWEGRR